MSEQAPTFSKAPEDERDEVAKLERQLAAKKFDVQQKEAFGKYDVTVPNEGEINYTEYIETHSGDGIVRDGDVLRSTATGNFASQADYEAQNGTSQDYYDKLGGLVNSGEYELPSLEGLGLLQLAKEAAKARTLGDPIEEARVREAVENYLTMDAMSDDSESPEVAQARYLAEIDRYDSLVERISGRPAPEAAHADNSHSPAGGEGHPSARVDGAERPPVEPKLDPEVFFGNEKVTVQEVYKSAGGKNIAEIIGADGTKRLVHEEELTFVEPSADAAPAPASDSTGEAEPSTGNAEPASTNESSEATSGAGPTGGAEAAPAEATPPVAPGDGEPTVGGDTPQAGAEAAPTTDPATPEAGEPTTFDKIKGFFKGQAAEHQRLGGRAFWYKKWRDVADPVINYGVQEGMTQQEVEKKQNRNRVLVIAGVSLLAIGAAYAIGNHETGAHVSPDALPDAGGGGTGGEASGLSDQMRDILNNASGAHSGDGELPGGTETVSAASEYFTIPSGSGEGGEQLFTNLGIDPNKWYGVEKQLLNQFPNNFYLMNDGHVGLYAGTVPAGAQDIINSLK